MVPLFLFSFFISPLTWTLRSLFTQANVLNVKQEAFVRRFGLILYLNRNIWVTSPPLFLKSEKSRSSLPLISCYSWEKARQCHCSLRCLRAAYPTLCPEVGGKTLDGPSCYEGAALGSRVQPPLCALDFCYLLSMPCWQTIHSSLSLQLIFPYL